MAKVFKIVLTGGPCAGKTTAKKWIEDALEKTGYSVLFINETATDMMQGGITYAYCGDMHRFETVLIQLQKEKEKLFELGARLSGKNTVIVCDRGVLDAKAYLESDKFDILMQQLNTTEVAERDDYDAVFHLVTAANGAEQAYTLDNNSARWESVEQAREKDILVINAWTGHPHLRIIDNSTPFEEKMKRLVHEIFSFIGEPSPLEEERKYLIQKPDVDRLALLPNCNRVSIVQTYLVPTEEDSERCIKQRGTKGNYVYTLTEKLRVSSDTCVKKERRLSKDEYLDLLTEADTTAKTIRKDRYCLTENNQYFEIDVLPTWEHHAVLTIGLRNREDPAAFPEFVKPLEEISNNPQYSDYYLAHKEMSITHD